MSVPDGSEVVIRATPERAVVYTRGFRSEFGANFRNSVEVSFRPKRRGFIRPISAVSLAATGISSLSLMFMDAALGEHRASIVNGLVTLLLLSSTLFSAYVVRPEEHDLRAEMLAWIRALVGIGAFGNGMAAASVALNMPGAFRESVLLIGAISSGVAFVMSLVWWRRGSVQGRRIKEVMSQSLMVRHGRYRHEV